MIAKKKKKKKNITFESNLPEIEKINKIIDQEPISTSSSISYKLTYKGEKKLELEITTKNYENKRIDFTISSEIVVDNNQSADDNMFIGTNVTIIKEDTTERFTTNSSNNLPLGHHFINNNVIDYQTETKTLDIDPYVFAGSESKDNSIRRGHIFGYKACGDYADLEVNPYPCGKEVVIANLDRAFYGSPDQVDGKQEYEFNGEITDGIFLTSSVETNLKNHIDESCIFIIQRVNKLITYDFDYLRDLDRAPVNKQWMTHDGTETGRSFVYAIKNKKTGNYLKNNFRETTFDDQKNIEPKSNLSFSNVFNPRQCGWIIKKMGEDEYNNPKFSLFSMSSFTYKDTAFDTIETIADILTLDPFSPIARAVKKDMNNEVPFNYRFVDPFLSCHTENYSIFMDSTDSKENSWTILELDNLSFNTNFFKNLAIGKELLNNISDSYSESFDFDVDTCNNDDDCPVSKYGQGAICEKDGTGYSWCVAGRGYAEFCAISKYKDKKFAMESTLYKCKNTGKEVVYENQTLEQCTDKFLDEAEEYYYNTTRNRYQYKLESINEGYKYDSNTSKCVIFEKCDLSDKDDKETGVYYFKRFVTGNKRSDYNYAMMNMSDCGRDIEKQSLECKIYPDLNRLNACRYRDYSRLEGQTCGKTEECKGASRGIDLGNLVEDDNDIVCCGTDDELKQGKGICKKSISDYLSIPQCPDKCKACAFGPVGTCGICDVRKEGGSCCFDSQCPDGTICFKNKCTGGLPIGSNWLDRVKKDSFQWLGQIGRTPEWAVEEGKKYKSDELAKSTYCSSTFGEFGEELVKKIKHLKEFMD